MGISVYVVVFLRQQGFEVDFLVVHCCCFSLVYFLLSSYLQIVVKGSIGPYSPQRPEFEGR